MNHKVYNAVRRARRNNELHFLEEKAEILKAEEEKKKKELQAEAAMAELLGYDDEHMVSSK